MGVGFVVAFVVAPGAIGLDAIANVCSVLVGWSEVARNTVVAINSATAIAVAAPK
jgi:hypothetical protein